MSDPYLLRDGEGNPLSSIFHKPPCKEWVPKSMRNINNDPLYLKIVDVFDKVFPPIKKFHPDDMKGDEEE